MPLGVVGDHLREPTQRHAATPPALCLKSGNAAFLRGSSGAIASNIADRRGAARGVRQGRAARRRRHPRRGHRREAAIEFMRLRGVDRLPDPAGRAVADRSRSSTTPPCPYVIDGDGNCHVYVDASADLDMAADDRRQRQDAAAERVQRGRDRCSCTRRWPTTFLPRVGGRARRSRAASVTRRPASLLGRRSASRPTTTSPASSSTSSSRCAVVAVARRRHRPRQPVRHRATPRRSSPATSAPADRFTREVDAAAVIVNASTRFVDGEEFGFGAEIGISTQKLHARGPMGLRELTTAKYVVEGDGQIRGRANGSRRRGLRRRGRQWGAGCSDLGRGVSLACCSVS